MKACPKNLGNSAMEPWGNLGVVCEYACKTADNGRVWGCLSTTGEIITVLFK